MDTEIWADFNDLDEFGRVLTLKRLARVELFVGRQVVAGDYEGNACVGTVVAIEDNGVVALVLDLGTFHPSESVDEVYA